MHQLNHSKAAAAAMAAAAAKEGIERLLHCLQAGQSRVAIMLAPCSEPGHEAQEQIGVHADATLTCNTDSPSRQISLRAYQSSCHEQRVNQLNKGCPYHRSKSVRSSLSACNRQVAWAAQHSWWAPMSQQKQLTLSCSIKWLASTPKLHSCKTSLCNSSCSLDASGKPSSYYLLHLQ